MILLVTGSRCLTDSPAAEAWAREQIDRAMHVDVRRLVTGDAPGPDTWASEAARDADMTRHIYALDGTITTIGWGAAADGDTDLAIMGGPDAGRVTRWDVRITDELRCRYASRRQWPLVRDAVMVADVAAAVRAGRVTATALALIDPTSRTHGTEHTARLAEQAGIRVERQVWQP